MDPQFSPPPVTPAPSVGEVSGHSFGMKAFLWLVVIAVVLFALSKIFGIGWHFAGQVCPPKDCIYTKGKTTSTQDNFKRYEFPLSPLPKALSGLPLDPKPIQVLDHSIEAKIIPDKTPEAYEYVQTRYAYLTSKSSSDIASAFQSYLSKNSYKVDLYTSSSTTNARIIYGSKKTSDIEDRLIAVSISTENQASRLVKISVMDTPIEVKK